MKSETTWTSSFISFINELKEYISYWDSKNLYYFVLQNNKDYKMSAIYTNCAIFGSGAGSFIVSYTLSPELLTKLLDNNVIVSEISDVEYRIQRALGTVEIRKYKIDKQKLRELKDESKEV